MLIGAAAYGAASQFVGERAGHELNVVGGAVALGTAGYAMAYAPDHSVGPGLPRAALAAKEVLLATLGACAGAGLASLAPADSHGTASTVEATLFSVAMLAGTW